MKDVVGNYSEYNFPLDAQWTDIEYMLNYRNFEFDPDRYAGLPDFVDEIHKNGIHYVPMIDAGISARSP